MTRAVNLVRATGLAILFGFAGCGAAEPSQTATEAAAIAVATASPAPVPPTWAVRIHDFKYKRAVTRVRRGARVVWINRDAANHTVTFTTGPGDLGNVDERGTLAARFTHAGSYRYVCVYHPSMHGRIIVN